MSRNTFTRDDLKLRRKQCEGKLRYPSLKDARLSATEMSRRIGRDISPYRCRFCESWHVGHTPFRKEQNHE